MFLKRKKITKKKQKQKMNELSELSFAIKITSKETKEHICLLHEDGNRCQNTVCEAKHFHPEDRTLCRCCSFNTPERISLMNLAHRFYDKFICDLDDVQSLSSMVDDEMRTMPRGDSIAMYYLLHPSAVCVDMTETNLHVDFSPCGCASSFATWEMYESPVFAMDGPRTPCAPGGPDSHLPRYNRDDLPCVNLATVFDALDATMNNEQDTEEGPVKRQRTSDGESITYQALEEHYRALLKQKREKYINDCKLFKEKWNEFRQASCNLHRNLLTAYSNTGDEQYLHRSNGVLNTLSDIQEEYRSSKIKRSIEHNAEMRGIANHMPPELYLYVDTIIPFNK